MAGIRQEPFGKTTDGHEIMRYWLSDGVISVGILNLGGTIQSVLVPDRSGKMVDVALGYDDVHSYEVQDKFIGALIGRFGNRIARGKFSLDGKDYTLRTNDGRNHLHGGQGFDKRLWNVQTDGDSLVLTLTSPDGDEGYPGTLQVCVRYTVANRALIIDYQAQTDAPTLCNLTNHVYWNLSGHDAGTVGDQKITLNADYFTPVDNEAIPLGTLAPVTGTALDLRTPTAIGAHWDDPEEQLQNVGGYDHNFALRGSIGFLSPTAEVTSPATGITMQVETTLPGVQFYTGNALEGAPTGKNGAVYGRRTGFCLETQFYPDNIHHPDWPQAILRPGALWKHQTIYRFPAI